MWENHPTGGTHTDKQDLLGGDAYTCMRPVYSFGCFSFVLLWSDVCSAPTEHTYYYACMRAYQQRNVYESITIHISMLSPERLTQKFDTISCLERNKHKHSRQHINYAQHQTHLSTRTDTHTHTQTKSFATRIQYMLNTPAKQRPRARKKAENEWQREYKTSCCWAVG